MTAVGSTVVNRDRRTRWACPVSGADRTAGLPIGTRVQKGTGDRARLGVVMHHEPEHSRGCFPVRFDDGLWEMLDASEVTVVAPPSRVDCSRGLRKEE
jgi:hypothetical protein